MPPDAAGRASMTAVVITGPPGAGKSAVLTALSDALSDDEVAHAAVEVEALVWTHPALTEEQSLRHVRVHCELVRDAGHQLLLLARTLESDDDVVGLLAAIGADETFVVRLEADPVTLAGRITARERAGWRGLPALVEHARALAAGMPGLAGVDLVLSTERQRPEAVAERLRAALPALAAGGERGTVGA